MRKKFYYSSLLSILLLTSGNSVFASINVAPVKATVTKSELETSSAYGHFDLENELKEKNRSGLYAIPRPQFVPAQPPEYEETDIAFYISNDNESGIIEIFRSQGDTLNFQHTTTVPYDKYLFVDANLKPRTAFYYKMRAIVGSDTSAFSDIEPFATRSIIYLPTVSAKVINTHTVEFTITDNTYAEFEYVIEEESPGNSISEYVYFPTDSGSTVVTQVSVEPNTTYTFAVVMSIYAEGAPRVIGAQVTLTTPAACANIGTITWEVWTGIPGTDVSAIPLSQPPTEINDLLLFESPANYGTNYGARVRGYICPPYTGDYVFWISSDDKSELYLSTDENPANKTKIASVTGHTSSRQWDKYATQQSSVIHLNAGYLYYVEALHKEASGGDHLAVGWQLPDGTLERPISGDHLLNYTEPTPVVCEGTGSIKWEVWNNISGTTIFPMVYNQLPDLTTTLPVFETPQYHGNNYASRVRGYLCPPVSGEYTFWISGDDMSELWLSTNDNPSNRKKIAHVPGYTPYRKWDKYPSQQSETIQLEAGQRYYVEVRHKEVSGADHISVGWQLPGGELERPIQGSSLIPFEDVAPNCAEVQPGPIVRGYWLNVPGTSVASIPINTAEDGYQFLGEYFETVTYFGNNYGSQIEAWICVPVTGDYTFWISSDDNGELWLGTTDNPTSRRRIASVPGATNVRQWDKYASQKSAPIHLQAGYKYYIEALQKEANGNDHVEVGWQLPDGTMERPIHEDRLIMYADYGAEMAQARTGDVTVIPSREIEGAMTIHPNPAKGNQVVLALKAEDAMTTKIKVQVISMRGIIVYDEDVDCENGKCDGIPLTLQENLQPGIYTVNVVGRKRLSKRLVIE